MIKKNFIRLDQNGFIERQNIKPIIASSDLADKLIIFADFDTDGITPYRVIARVKRSDNFIVGPVEMPAKVISLTADEVNSIGVGDYAIDVGGEIPYQVRGRELEFAKNMTAIKGEINITIVYQEVDNEGAVIRTSAQQSITMVVAKAVDEILTENELNEIRLTTIDRDFSDIGINEQALKIIDTVLGKNSSGTKQFTLEQIETLFNDRNIKHIGYIYGLSDLNNYEDFGTYHFHYEGFEKNGLLLVDAATKFQFVIFPNELLIRNSTNGNWNAWQTINLLDFATTENRTVVLEQFMNDILDGTRASKKAEQDSLGNVIHNKYVSKSNPVITGNLDANALKITSLGDGTNPNDAVNLGQLLAKIIEHNESETAHTYIRNLIAALQGAYIYRGTINYETDNIDAQKLNDRLFEIMGRTAKVGDTLVDLNKNEWYFNGSDWDNYGQFIIGLASLTEDGLMTKEHFKKLSDLYTKATLDSLLNDRYTKAEVDSIVNMLKLVYGLEETKITEADPYADKTISLVDYQDYQYLHFQAVVGDDIISYFIKNEWLDIDKVIADETEYSIQIDNNLALSIITSAANVLVYGLKTKPFEIKVDDETETNGKYISKIEVDNQKPNKLLVSKKDLPQGFSGNYDDLTNKPALYNKAEIDTMIGDIESALDAILGV